MHSTSQFSRFTRSPILAFLFTCLVLTACSQQAADAPVVDDSAYAAPSDADAKAFAKKVTQAVESGDALALALLVDWDRLGMLSVRGLGTAKMQKSFVEGLKKGARKSNGLCSQIVNHVKGGGSYRFLRTRSTDGKPEILFRMLTPESMLNYHGYILSRKDGKIRVEDIWVGITGERLSQTFRRMFLPYVAARKSLLSRLMRKDRDWATNIGKFEEMSNAIKRNDPKKALELAKTLPDTIRQSKMSLLIEMQAAMKLEDDDKYMDVMTAFRKHHAGDPCIDLVSIDWHLLRKDYDKALEACANVGKSVGGDAYTDVLRARIAAQGERFDEAKAWADQAAKAEPSLIQAYWAMVDICLTEKDHEGTLAALLRLRDDHGMTFQDLKSVPAYADFVKSPSYEKFVESTKGDGDAADPEKGADKDPEKKDVKSGSGAKK